ncbi:MAG TPA: hypothetical protein VK645_12680 [Chitinophagaceae bacterium]|jgi:hypothetical protein|nr:hypothetical protein [Chitinophagaceae bacterium]
MEKTTVRLCLECGKPLKKAKRSDSKFCDDECRNDYFNKLKNAESNEIGKIQNILKSNRRILKELLGKNPEVIIDKAVLLKLGFNFNYHTHHVISKTRSNEFIFSFNYGYHAMDNSQYKIVKSFK